jgi:hypothetical protein
MLELLASGCDFKTLSHANTYDMTYTQWICLLSAVDVAGKHKTIQFTVTCVMITIVQKIVILKCILDHGRSFSNRALPYLKNSLLIFLKSIGLNSLSLKILVVQFRLILINLSFNFDWGLQKIRSAVYIPVIIISALWYIATSLYAAISFDTV